MTVSARSRGRMALTTACTMTLVTWTATVAPPVASGEEPRFQRASRGIVDARTGVEWRDGFPRMLDWASAREHCRSLDGAGGWRLPDVDELEAVVDVRGRDGGGFALAREVFGRPTGSAYWTGEARTRRDRDHRLAVDEDGSIEVVPTLTPLAVRCVRRVAR